VQVKLLRVLQDGQVDRLGGTAPVRVDVRIVAATNKDLQGLVAAGVFREDLYYRLAVFPVRLPPLRERREDVPLLAAAFLRRLSEKNGKRLTGFSPAALAALEAAPWPGNVRELQHAVERAVILARGEVVELVDLPDAVGLLAPAAGGASTAPGPTELTVPLGTTMEEIERRVIRETLRQARGDKTLAAQLLGIAPRTIYRKLDRDGSGRLRDPTESEEPEPA
jgi:two-component system response regulator HydG